MVTFNNLPPELLIHLQRSVDSPRDLHSLLSASPACLQAFLPRRIQILTSVLKNAIPPGALRHALAAIQPKPETFLDRVPGEEHRAAVTAIAPFLLRYFSDEPLQVPEDVAGITTVLRLHALVSRFSNEYFLHAGRRLGALTPQTPLDALGRPVSAEFPPMSLTERTRLMRAFYHYEIICRLFPPKDAYEIRYANYENDDGPREVRCLGREAQFELFVRWLQPWEVEEMSCVHNYLICLTRETIEDFKAAPFPFGPVMNKASPYAPGAPERYIRGIATWGRQADGTPAPLRRNPWRLCPDPPVPAGRTLVTMPADNEERTNAMVFTGLRALENLFLGDDFQRQKAYVYAEGCLQEYFPDSIEVVFHDLDEGSRPVDPGHSLFTKEAVQDDLYHANLGYHIFGKPILGKYREIYDEHNVVMYDPLREMGYAFWDSGRIGIESITQSLEKASAISEDEVLCMRRMLRVLVDIRLAERLEQDMENRAISMPGFE